jgi:rfaE bifunctional protein kinase chain/domain
VPAGIEELTRALSAVAGARVVVCGDFALDAYWDVASADGETSLETGLPVCRIAAQRYTLGGAGNVAANLRALGVGEVRAVGVVGDDPFGHALLERLDAIGVDHECLTLADDWQTLVFAKPHEAGVERSRLDFGTRNVVTPQIQRALDVELGRAFAGADAVLFNQQVAGGIASERSIARVNELAAAAPGCRLLVDARDVAASFPGAMLKLNAREARALCSGRAAQPRALIAGLRARGWRNALFLTLGAEGLLAADGDCLHAEPGIPLAGPLDPVGAGDAVAAALLAVLASGGSVPLAARIANLAAAVTVRKLRTTGTATPAEIVALAQERGR